MSAEPLLWIDGRVVTASDATLPALDQGTLIGDGVFETLRVVGGRVRLLDRHLSRLSSACDRVEIAHPGDDDLRVAIERLLDESGIVDGRLRISISGGAAGLGPGRGDTPSVVVAIGPAVVPDGPARLLRGPWVRNERSPLAGVKSSSWAENAALLRLARANDCDDVLLSDTRGCVSECAASNVFLVIDDALLTPSLDSGCLPGVVRGALVDARVAVEATIDDADLSRVTEGFITSAFVGVRPISAIGADELPIVDGAPTRRAAAFVSGL